uniref:TIR domain-containing protein n=1 Tax=Neogobius melanostomus TaxID=47308 RepID=A0A8C6U7N6_9GOBI
MVFHTISLFSFLFLLLLPRPLLFYSLKNCTTDAHDNSIVFCDNRELEIIPPDIPRTATYLDLSENQLTKISQNDLTGFIRLQTLSVRINVISQIEVGAFSDLLALNELNLARNKLRNLSDNMFDGLSHLSILDLSRNKIKSISKFAFYNLDNLQELNLWNNNLSLDLRGIGRFFDKGLLDFACGIPSLRMLYLQYNDITVLNNSLLQSCANLTELDLSQNSMTDLAESSLQIVDSVENLYLLSSHSESDKGLLEMACEIPTLQKLDSVDYSIPILNESILQSCTNLTELHLQYNSMSDLTESSLQMLTRLTRLTINQNQLSRIPLTIRNMSTLTFLSFEDNLITELHCLDFTNLPSLTELNLKSNKISKLETCVFQDLRNLKVLEIQNNFLTALSETFGSTLKHLVTLNADGNNFRWFQRGTFQNLPALRELNVKSVREIIVDNGAFMGLKELKRLSSHLRHICFLQRHDEDWVYGELLHELEERQGWKLCLHHRDFIPGTTGFKTVQ